MLSEVRLCVGCGAADELGMKGASICIETGELAVGNGLLVFEIPD